MASPVHLLLTAHKKAQSNGICLPHSYTSGPHSPSPQPLPLSNTPFTPVFPLCKASKTTTLKHSIGLLKQSVQVLKKNSRELYRNIGNLQRNVVSVCSSPTPSRLLHKMQGFERNMQRIYLLKQRKSEDLEGFLRESPVNRYRETRLVGHLRYFMSERKSDYYKTGVESTEITCKPERSYREDRKTLQMSRFIASPRGKSEGNTEIAGLKESFGQESPKLQRKKGNLRDGKAIRPSLR